MPAKLAEHLPNANETARAALFGSITDVMAFPFDDPTRVGVIAGASPPPLMSLYLETDQCEAHAGLAQRTAT